MIASIVDTGTLAKVVLYSLLAGVGIAVVFGAGVASVGSLLDAVRERRTAASAGWAVLSLACLTSALAAVVLGIVVMAAKS